MQHGVIMSDSSTAHLLGDCLYHILTACEQIQCKRLLPVRKLWAINKMPINYA